MISSICTIPVSAVSKIPQKTDEKDIDISKEFEEDISRLFNKGEDSVSDEDMISEGYSSSLEDEEDLIIKDDDNIIIAGHAEEGEGIPQLIQYVYIENDNNLYVHHDIRLSSLPLSITRIKDYGQQDRRNYIAVSSFDPVVEIWDMNVIEPSEPTEILGTNLAGEVHKDAIMAIDSHPKRPLLLTGGADNKVGLWDIGQPKEAISMFSHHKDKVQSVSWSLYEDSLLASGSYDKHISIFDIRDRDSSLAIKVDGDVEMIQWDPFNSHELAISDDKGHLYIYDKRNHNTPLVRSEITYAPLTALSYHKMIPGILLMGSLDTTIRLLDLERLKNATTDYSSSIIFEKQSPTDKIYTVECSIDSPMVFIIGGQDESIYVWNAELNKPTVDIDMAITPQKSSIPASYGDVIREYIATRCNI